MKSIKMFAVLLIILITTVTCNKKTAKILLDATLKSCKESIVFISSWWNKVPSETTIAIDPMGGWVIIYWIGEDGKVYHGTPGVNAKKGYETFAAIPPEVYTASNENQAISSEDYKQYQNILFDAKDYDGFGLHFTQFVNFYYRARNDGIIFSDPTAMQYSIPEIISFDQDRKAFCFAPIYSSECNTIGTLPLPDPNTILGSNDTTTINVNRIMPNSIEMTESERLNYCVIKLESE